MEGRRGLSVVLVLALLGQSFAVPLDMQRLKLGYADNELNSVEAGATDLEAAGTNSRRSREDVIDVAGRQDDEPSKVSLESTTTKTEYATPVQDDDDSNEDDDDFESMSPAPSAGGGSNIFSLLRLANALFPSSSGGANPLIRNLLRGYFNNQFINNGFNPNLFDPNTLLRRKDIIDNIIEVDEIKGLKPPPFQRQEIDETTSEEQEGDDSESEASESDENDAAEESVETGNENGGNGNGNNGNGSGGNSGNGNGSKQDNNASKSKSGSRESNGKLSDEDNSEDDFSDEPPEGDGQGGGILGILAGLSGGEDGSDLGTLLATISGIVGQLSGDEGFDLNSVIASGIGLFVGILSGGNENPGEIIAQFLLTSLDTITGGGAQNNGEFFGKFLSKLLRGSSAQSKTPSSEPASPFWTLKMDILRALLQFGTSLIGSASSSSSAGSG